MKSKKILYAASNMQHIKDFHLEYIEGLRKKGAEVTVMARGEGADINIPFEKKLFSLRNRKARRMIRAVLSKGGYDAVILNTSLAAFHIRLAMPRKNRPRVLNIVHGYLFSENVSPIKARLLLFCERLLRRRTDAIITMNREDYDTATRYKLAERVMMSRGMGAHERRMITPPDNIRREYFPSGAYALCFVGELSPRKNQEFLIRALRRIKSDIPSAVLCLVGDGSDKERLHSLSESLGLSESVIFAGRRSDAADFMRASDLYVSASSIEGMPFNIIEAMGVGATVLASRVKGHEDLIDDGIDGYLYDFGNIDDFVNKTCQIYTSGRLSEQRIKEKYKMFEYSSVYPETLSRIEEFCIAK